MELLILYSNDSNDKTNLNINYTNHRTAHKRTHTLPYDKCSENSDRAPKCIRDNVEYFRTRFENFKF